MRLFYVEDNATKNIDIEVSNNEDVHVSFDYDALRHEMALFNEKAEAERDLLACIKARDFGEVIDGALETTHEVLEKFENPFTMEQNAAQEWRSTAVEFLKRIRDEAIVKREDYLARPEIDVAQKLQSLSHG